MPKFGDFVASIEVDKKEVPEYGVRVEDSKKLVSCWIPSEAGKTFSVCWQSLGPLTIDISGCVKIDGVNVGGRIVRRGGPNVRTEHSDCTTSATTACDFRFSQIAYTDDDAYLNAAISNIGEIKLDIWNVVVGEAGSPSNRPITSDMKVHERSKKLGSHRVKFEAKTITAGPCYDTTRIRKVATFIFTYRPLDILQANGIAPPPVPVEPAKGNNKRKTLEDDDVDVKEEASEEDDDDEDEDIDDRVQKLKDKLKRLESRRAKKRKAKVKKEDHRPIINEVIDLT